MPIQGSRALPNIDHGAFEWRKGDDTITARTYFKGEGVVISAVLRQSATLDKVNRWNEEHLFTRAIFSSGHPRLQAILDCRLGVSEEVLPRLIDRFYEDLDTFREYLKK